MLLHGSPRAESLDQWRPRSYFSAVKGNADRLTFLFPLSFPTKQEPHYLLPSMLLCPNRKKLQLMFERVHAVPCSINMYVRMHNMIHYISMLPVPIIFSGVQQSTSHSCIHEGRSWGECFSDWGLVISIPIGRSNSKSRGSGPELLEVAGSQPMTRIYSKDSQFLQWSTLMCIWITWGFC